VFGDAEIMLVIVPGWISSLAGLQISTLVPSVPRNAWHAHGFDRGRRRAHQAVSSGWRARHRPTAPSPSHTNTLGTAPSVERCCHQPAYKSSAVRVGINTADAHREYPHTIVNTGSAVALRAWPHPTGTTTSGNQKSHWAISPAAYVVRDAGSGGRYTGRNSRTRSLRVRIEYDQPIRSAITVAGIRG